MVSLIRFYHKVSNCNFFLCLDTRPERIRLSRWYNKDNHLSNSKKSRDHDDNGPKILQLSTSKQYNYIIENQRLRISREMTSFPFDKDHDVNDYIPDEGGQPVRAMVIPKDKYMYLTCFYEIFTLTLFWQKFCESNALTKEVTKMVVDFTKNNLVREIISSFPHYTVWKLRNFLSRFFGKKFVKLTVSLKKLLRW